MQHTQASSAVLMVEPTTFGFDEETATTNSFQHHSDATPEAIRTVALTEFHTAVQTLRHHGVDVLVFSDPDPTPKPDAVFPNNWFTTWPDGTVYTYPMATPTRRTERSPAAIDLLRQHFQVSQVVDLTASERQGHFLEGTGAIVFDHPEQVAYACLSPRCDAALFQQHARTLGYRQVAFHAFGPDGLPVYHTNVIMGIQSKTAVLYSEGITDIAERNQALESLRGSGRQVIEITTAQMLAFCGNLLEVRNRAGESYVVLSRTAYDAFTPEQRALLATSGILLPIAIPTIEQIGGGSMRCMLAEIFLSRKA